jgi:hypothetical protein
MAEASITVTGNAAVTDCLSGNNGGAVYVNESSTFTVSGYAYMAGNSAGGYGGCLYGEGGATLNLEGACRLQRVCMCVRAVLFFLD